MSTLQITFIQSNKKSNPRKNKKNNECYKEELGEFYNFIHYYFYF